MSTTAHSSRETTESIIVGRHSVTVEMFLAGSHDKHPALILLHGADGPIRRADEYRAVARELARGGYNVLRPYYFEATLPDTPPEQHLTNPNAHLAWIQVVSACIDLAKSLPHEDRRHIGIVGFSLGGYLALAAAAADPRIDAIVEFFGGLPDVFVPRTQSRMPPTLILHGEADSVVPVSEAHRIHQYFQRNNLPVEIHTYPAEGHHFSVAAKADATRRARTFLDKHLNHKHLP